MVGTWFVISFLLNPDYSWSILYSKKFDPKTSGIVIESQKLAQKKPQVKILGKVKNTGKDTWSGLSTFLAGDIRSGDVRAFKISNCCGKEIAPIKFDHYKLFLDSAYYERPKK